MGNQGKVLHIIKHKYTSFTFSDEKNIIFAGFLVANNSFDVFFKKKTLIFHQFSFVKKKASEKTEKS